MKRFTLVFLTLILLLSCVLMPAQAAWKKDSTGWYYVNASGQRVKNAWQKDSKGWCYLDGSGYMVTNRWVKDSKGWCYIGADGYCVTNCWKKDSTGWVYLDGNGSMVYNKWIKDSKGWCYVGANGYMVTNQWVKDSTGWCHVGANGYMEYNKWVKDSKGWCYVGAKGYMEYNKWIKDSTGWCHVGANGYMEYNKWIKDSKGWCYVGANGYMVTNQWAQDSKGWCYIGANGYCVTNCWKKDSTGWIWLDANGSMTKSKWVQDGGKWYYLDGNGYMVTGWKNIGGSRYYFYSSGVMAANTTIDGIAIGSDGKAKNQKISLSIGIPSNAKIMSLDQNALTRWLEEETGYDINFVIYAGGTDITTQIAVTIAARQELPDILYGIGMNDAVISAYGNEGYFTDLSPYYKDKNGASKTFWTRLDACLTDRQAEDVITTISDAESGKIYGVPTIETSSVSTRMYQPWINQAWLDKLGLSMPTNIQELYDVLVAFKTRDPNGNGYRDEIPLFGSEKAGGSASVVNWLINMFLYYDPNNLWQDYNGDGKLEPVYTQDAYREALKFVNKLYEEQLLTNMVYTATSNEMKQITTPSSGTAFCGIFCGEPTIHCAWGNGVLYEYAPVPLWGYAVESGPSCRLNTFITSDCDYPDDAFRLLMTLFSEEGSMRVRYGEYGVNWTDADSGAKSSMGLNATYKLLSDPLTQQNTAHWGTIASCLNHYAQGESAQISNNVDAWTLKKDMMLAESRRFFDAAAAANNPSSSSICPMLKHTASEQEDTEMIRVNINSFRNNQMTAFVTGIGSDINSDADWNTYLNNLNSMGLSTYAQYIQTAYNRQK